MRPTKKWNKMKQFNNSQTLWLKVPLCMLLGTNTLRCTNALLRFFIELKYFLIFILNSFFHLFTSNKDTIWYLQLFCLFLKLEFHYNYCCNTFMCSCVYVFIRMLPSVCLHILTRTSKHSTAHFFLYSQGVHSILFAGSLLYSIPREFTLFYSQGVHFVPIITLPLSHIQHRLDR